MRERNRVTKQGLDAMITNYLRLEKELYAAQRELVSLKTGIPKTGIPVDDCNQGLSLIESKTLRIMSAYDEREVRERLRKTRERLNAAQGLAAALMPKKK